MGTFARVDLQNNKQQDAGRQLFSSLLFPPFHTNILPTTCNMPRAKRKATPPPALARDAFLKKGGKEADLMQEALKKVEALELGKRTTEEVDKIATDYGLQSKAICKAWDATCKKQERRGGDPRSVLEVDENEELVRIVLESQYTADLFNPVIQGIDIRAIAADFLATRGIILPYINGLPNENWLERWRNRNPRLKGAKTMYTEEWEPLVIPRKRRASSYESVSLAQISQYI